ncbi:MAG TPA: RpiB/LacA/LacB family sugar-phosphate isomerase [Ginsengibacter sp.]|nr:RpiB/LacA/LacB family sugar-phosphate isomerase [Ginsengibacter sp.]HRP18872.1 RpiB/LacA/LacB family sugar-phosphate isomerase [Ginsengibacter sp.]HRP43435.1 RpiB/LacA/LacB family sugar-phosphate isomerase [Ginsengibacter sp.]
MKIGLAADHGGYELKEKIKNYLEAEGHEVTDYGAFEYNKDDDYPDFVFPLANAVSEGKLTRGIAVCGSGIGASIAANKVKGVRAALVTDCFSARQGVEDDNMNIICLGGRVVADVYAELLIKTFLEANFSGLERHNRRLGKVKSVELKNHE